MHSNQNSHPEQGRFLPKRLTYETPQEKPKGGSENPQEKEQKEQPSPRALLADMSAEIGVEGPMKEMIALERGLTTEGQKAEYSYQNEKLFATREKDRVVWRNEKGEVVQKAVWLKERTDARTDEHQKNLGAYWTEVSQKYHKDESVRKKAEAQTGTDLQKADGEEIYNLQGGWDKTRMSRMFLGEKMGNGLTFKVDLKGKDKFENYVGAGDILPATVTKILVIDTKGQQRTGTRQIQNGRVGYYDAQGYIPVFSGYTISVLETISEASAQAREMMMKEQQNHTEMKGTIWRKSDPAPTELGGVSPTSGYRYAMVNGKRVEVKPPRPGEKVYEAKEPAKIQAGEDKESKVEMYQFGKERMYVNAPKDMEKFKGKKPEIIFYFHGNGGNIDENLPWITAKVKKMRDEGRPVVLVIPENRLGGWQDFKQPGTFTRMMSIVDGITGAPDAKITITSHSGGYWAVQKILDSGEHSNRISTLGMLDSMYGSVNQSIIRFASDPTKKVRTAYTPHLADKHEPIVASLLPGVSPVTDGRETVWTDESGRIEVRTASVGHGAAKWTYFESFVS